MIVFNVNCAQQQDAFVKDISLDMKGSGGWGTSMMKDQKDQYSGSNPGKVLNTSEILMKNQKTRKKKKTIKKNNKEKKSIYKKSKKKDKEVQYQECENGFKEKIQYVFSFRKRNEQKRKQRFRSCFESKLL